MQRENHQSQQIFTNGSKINIENRKLKTINIAKGLSHEWYLSSNKQCFILWINKQPYEKICGIASTN